MDDSAILCDEIIELYNKDTEAKLYDKNNRNENKTACKTQNFYFLLEFLLNTVALLIAVSIYCCLTKYRAKQKQKLLLFHDKNNELTEVLY